MLLTCNHCRTQVEGKLNRDTDEVVCLDCGNTVKGISDFMKASMRRNRDFLEEVRRAFSFHSEECPEKKPACPGKLSDDNKSIVCEKCGTPFEVTAYMLRTLKDLKAQDDRSQTATPEQPISTS